MLLLLLRDDCLPNFHLNDWISHDNCHCLKLTDIKKQTCGYQTGEGRGEGQIRETGLTDAHYCMWNR